MVDPNRTLRSSVVMLHGFAQTGGCLGPVADALVDHTVLRPDLPGHGGAAALADLDLWGIASHLARAIGPTLDGPAVWFGYSMGGRVALHVVLAHPELVSGLVLLGATAGIADAADREDRRTADLARADHLEAVGLDRFLDEWLAQPLFAGLPEWARFDAERRRNTVPGLAGSLRHAGTGSMELLWDRLGSIDVPVLCVVGEHDRSLAARKPRSLRRGSKGGSGLPHGTLGICERRPVAGFHDDVEIERTTGLAPGRLRLFRCRFRATARASAGTPCAGPYLTVVHGVDLGGALLAAARS